MYDLGRAFKAPFQDKDWVSKVLLGLLWGVIPFTIPAVYGAQLEYIRGVSEGDETLPAWSDFGKKWVEGFMVVIAAFILYLPIIAIGSILLFPLILASTSSGSGESMMGAVLGGSMCLFFVIALIYGIAMSIYFSAATVNFAMKGGFGAFFAFGEILAHIRGDSKYFTAWLYAWIIGAAGGAVTGALGSTGIGVIVSGGVAYLVAIMSGHVLGQWAAVAYGRNGLAAAAAPSAPPTGLPVRPAPPVPGSVPPPAAPVTPPPAPAAPLVPPAAPLAPPAVPPAAPEIPAAPEAPAAPEPAAPAPEPPAPTAPESDEIL